MSHKFYETARRAHTWISFHPDNRAASECAYYDEIMQEFRDSPLIQAKFERLFALSLAAKSRCASSMITGPARFPVEKQRAASERENKITGEMVAYVNRVRAARKKEAYYAEHPEARPIMSGDADAVERLKLKLESAKKYHAQLKEVKALIKKGEDNIEACKKVGLPKPVVWHSFNIQYANKAVKELEAKIAKLESVKAKAPKEIEINGARVIENTEAMRLQIFFNGKPEREIIELLKSNAFKWAPSIGAWQRQLTESALYAFRTYVEPKLTAQG